MSDGIAAFQLRDPALHAIADKVLAGERLDAADGLALYATADLLGLGRLADFANARRNGDRVLFSANQHINPTNVCVLRNTCVFCSFARMPKEEGAYTRSLEEVYHEAEQARGMPTREFHIVGGLHPKLRLSYYTDMLRGLKERHPDVHIKALTAVEIAHLARIEQISERDVLLALKEAGLTSLPGGGAEVFSTAVRATIAERKLTGEEWIRVHRTAHELGIPTNCTMLYGHVETADDRIAHLSMLRALQDETHGFLTYIPLAYHPDHNELGRGAGPRGHRHDRVRGSQEHRRRAAVPRQRPAHQDPLADGDAVPLADRARASAATTSRARWCTSGSTTRPARTPRCTCTISSSCGLIRGAGKRPVERDSLYQCGARGVRRPAARSRRFGAARRCRWCTPHEAGTDSVDQLLSDLRRDRSRAWSRCRRSW